MATDNSDLKQLTDRENEILDKLQEECSELIQVISKIRRFGVHNSNPNIPNAVPNTQRFINELGDLLECVDDLARGQNTLGLTSEALIVAMSSARAKIRKYTKFAKEDHPE